MKNRYTATPTDYAEHGRQLVEARYRNPQFAEKLADAGWNETLDVLLSHRSVRHYLDKPLPSGTLELIITAAQSAATTSNLHAWSVIAVEDPERKARLARHAANQRHIHAAPMLLVFVADLARLRAVSEAENLPGTALDYVEAFIFAIADAAFGAQNAVVALESLGLGCCYIGAMRNNAPAVAEELALPSETMVVFGMTVGYPDPSFGSDIKPRLGQGIVLHREQYTPPNMDDIARYNATLNGFQAEQDMRIQDWSRQAAERVKDVPALTGREILREFLGKSGFKLK